MKLHDKQGQAFLSDSKIILCASGIQGGKTSVGALWLLRQFSKWKGPDHNFIIGAPTYKILNQSTLPTFMKYCSQFGAMKKSDAEFHLHSGAKIYFRTGTDPFSVEGITNVRAIWLDEAGMCSYTFWVNLEGRAARTNAPIICTTTPYGMNWPYHSLIKPFKSGERTDIAYYEWLSIDNPSFPREEYERQKQILDQRTFRRKYMGLHERMEGLVYELQGDVLIEERTLSRPVRYFAGVDWGFSEGHEFGLLIRAIVPDGFTYEVSEFKGSGLDPQQQIDLCRAQMKTYGIEMFYCDPSRPDMIALMNKNGIPAIGFQQGKENFKPLLPSIQAHQTLIRSGKYRIFKDRCPNLMDEYETYHWAEYDEEKPQRDAPVKVNDHLMDCARMITIGTMHVKIKDPKPLPVSMARAHVDKWNPTKKSKSSGSWDSY